MTIIHKEHNGGVRGLLERISSLGVPNVYIGVPSSKNSTHEGGINMATLVAVHELGANIKHSGGTRYQNKANGNLAKFVRNDFVGPTSGVTGSHTIVIPERSFIRSTMKDNEKRYADLMLKGFRSVLRMESTVEVVYQKIGITISDDVKSKILTGSFVPLKPSTIKKKGSSKPLVDTGEMRNSISYEVR